MKKTLAVFLVFQISAICFGQNARVNSYLGKPVFWRNLPVAEYEIVFQFRNPPNFLQLQPTQCEGAVKEAIIAARKEEFDAIIVTMTEYDLAIRFKDKDADKTLCTPLKSNGIPFYVDCEPVQKYTRGKKVIVFRRDTAGNGFSDWSIAEYMTKKKHKGDAVLIGSDNVHYWIKFEI